MFVLKRFFTPDVIEQIVIVRDGRGKISAVLPVDIDEERLDALAAELNASLGKYAREDRPVMVKSAPGASRLIEEAEGVRPTLVDGTLVRVLERRIVASEWLRKPSSDQFTIPVVVFSSLKGGVGRSTALSVVASHLSKRGQRVLAIDFDLEAPGIGTMLLRANELPPYGTLDYFVERALGELDEQFMLNLTGDSYLGADGARVTIIPAIGSATVSHPENALAKISLAYLESFDESGVAVGLTEKLRQLVAHFERSGAYDIVLIDARAGLHETGPAALFGLGAEILMFGVDQPQTFLGYRLLLSHIEGIGGGADWKESLHFVHAKASSNTVAQTRAEDRFNALLEILQPKTPANDNEALDLTETDLDVVWSSDAPDTPEVSLSSNPVLRVLDDTRYQDFDPVADGTLLSNSVYKATFESLIEFVDELLELE